VFFKRVWLDIGAIISESAPRRFSAVFAPIYPRRDREFLVTLRVDAEDRKVGASQVELSNSVPPMADSLRAAEVRQQLDRILADSAFSGASRRSRLLRYLVEQALEDRPEGLKESVIATEVFERAPDYDPQIDSVVRVEIGRLRDRLAEYYVKAGPEEPVHIEIPRGGYRPIFVFRELAPQTNVALSAPETTVEPAREKAHPDLPHPDSGHPDRDQRPGWRSWKSVAAAAVAMAAIVTAWVIWRARTSPPATPTAVAVLPFLNLSGDAADNYLGDGISDELTETLAEFNDLRVVARTSAFQYKGKSVDVREIGQNLRAGAVIEGSVARRDGRFHVIVQLIRTSDGYHLWSHTYDASLAELPSVEAGIAQVAREKLAPSAPAPKEVTTRNPEAHDLYMRAAYELNRHTVDSTKQAMELAGQASAKDPSFAQPYVIMAAGESQLNTLLVQSPHAAAERALADIAKALALDPQNNPAHAQKALLAYTDQWDWPQAEREFRLALAAGSHSSAENLYGWSLMTRGRFAEARQHLQIAAELDPLSLGPQLNQVQELIHERNYPEARSKVEAILRTAPVNPVALYLASTTAYWQRDCPGATAWSRKLLDAYPGAMGSVATREVADVLCGRPFDFKSEWAEQLRKHPSGYFSPYSGAATFAFGNDADIAMSYLQKSAELREPVLLSLKVDRAFDSIRQDPRFIALERRLGLLD
jgi:serine/threonine-protein kinase